MRWFIKCIGSDFANFDGRARRCEFWYFQLFSLIFIIVAMVLDLLIFGPLFTPFHWLLSLYLLVPQLAVSVRRLHDTGRSGYRLLWYYIMVFVWIVAMVITGMSNIAMLMQSNPVMDQPMSFWVVLTGGSLVFTVWSLFFLVWFCIDGDKGENKYGPDPKAE